MIALLMGTILTLVALAFVLYPLFMEPRAVTQTRAAPPTASPRGRGDQAIAALREVEFDRATGKLSAQDYEELKVAYTREAVAAMRSDQALTARAVSGAQAPTDDELESVIRRYRTGAESAAAACPSCGPRPERDAVYCSSCGRFLAASCPRCAAPVTEAGARFCSTCGEALGAEPLLTTQTA